MIRGKMSTVSSRKDELVMVRIGKKWKSKFYLEQESYYIDERADSSWLYRPRYRRSERTAYWIDLALFL